MSASFFMTVATYVLVALGLYTIAKRRGIRKPWLAWIPVANMWLLGCISDQYRYVARNQEKSKRKLMLTLTIITIIAVAVLLCFSFTMLLGLFQEGMITQSRLLRWAEMSDDAIAQDMVELITDWLHDDAATLPGFTQWFGIVGIASMVGGVAAIWLTVLQYMAYHDLFMAANPNRATAYLLLSIFLGNLVTALLVFLSKDSDEGMPPRQTVVEQATWVPPADTYM